MIVNAGFKATMAMYPFMHKIAQKNTLIIEKDLFHRIFPLFNCCVKPACANLTFNI
jgi:hypothetical protein